MVFWRHSAIVTMFGVCLSTPLSIIMEQAAGGSLSDYLQGHPKTPVRQSQLISAAEQLAQALHYLVCNHSLTFTLSAGHLHGHWHVRNMTAFTPDTSNRMINLYQSTCRWILSSVLPLDTSGYV